MNNIKDKLKKLIKDLTQIENISDDQDIFELVNKTNLLYSVISGVNETFNVALTASEFAYYSSVNGLTEYFENRQCLKRPIVRIGKSGELPATPSQKGSWFLAKMGLSYSYHETRFYQIEGAVDPELFTESAAWLLKAHESLRTTFIDRLGEPFQVVNEQMKPEVSLHGFNNPVSGELEKLKNDFVKKLYDLKQGPLIRFFLAKQSDEQFLFGMTYHHIIIDGWSENLMFNDLLKFYKQLKTGEEIKFSSSNFQYADYAYWMKDLENHPTQIASYNFLKKKLEGFKPLNLPSDYSVPSHLIQLGDFREVDLEKHIAEGIKAVARSKGVSRFVVFYSAIYVLLRRYTNQKDICIGMPFANREHEDSKEIVGLFTNSLVARINPENEEASFNGILELVQNEIKTFKNYQHISQERLIELLNPGRGLGINPLFNVQVNFPPRDTVSSAELSLTLKRVPYHLEISKFNLTFRLLIINEDLLRVGLEYSTDLYKKDSIVAMMNDLIKIMSEVIKNPDTQVDKVQFVDEKEINNLVAEQVQSVDTGNHFLHELIEEQVEKNPDRTALIRDDQIISYRQLGRLSNQLANQLHTKGIRHGQVVAVFMDRSVEMVVSLIGILKAGASYLPLATDYPAERIAYMIQDSQAEMVICSEINREDFLKISVEHEITNIDLVIVSKDFSTFGDESENFQHAVNLESDHNAYVIYTSGSTGRPKGVMISHKAIVNHMLWMKSAFNWTDQDVFIQKTAFSFDASVWEFYMPLIIGGKLVLSSADQQSDPEVLIGEIKKYQITTFQATPTLLEFISNHASFPSCTSLKRIFSGGEALKRQLSEKVINILPVDIINLYGPTECTIDATFYHFSKEDKLDIVPIGKPVWNMKPHILDDYQNMVPIGVGGELFFEGLGLSNGYIHNEELTNKSFPLSSDGKNTRLYKTGDLVKIDHDGVLHYLGRKDQQLKIRGVRIEAGEIESVLSAIEGLKNTAIVQSGNVLVAYYNAEKEIPAEELRTKLLQALPVFMVPAHFVFLNALPFTPGGKIDRKALSERKIESTVKFESPETEFEIKIAEIWKEILSVDKIGVLDDFFELGGHSLLAMQILSRINREMNLNITLNELFNAVNIKALAKRAELSLSESGNVVVQDIISDYGESSEEFII